MLDAAHTHVEAAEQLLARAGISPDEIAAHFAARGLA
jgi:3-oxoacyl-[acyl-carrier-protein] synthase III